MNLFVCMGYSCYTAFNDNAKMRNCETSKSIKLECATKRNNFIELLCI